MSRKRARTEAATQTTTTRKIYKAKIGASRASSSATSFKGIIRSKQNAILVYGEPATTLTTYLTYQANNLFDPYSGVGGGQPRGFDQLALLYSTYMVKKATISVQFFPDGNQARDGGVFYLVAHSTGTAPANQKAYIEDRNTTSKTFHSAFRDGTNGYGTTMSKPLTISKTIDIAKFGGLPVNHDRNVSKVTTSPADGIYWTFSAFDHEGAQVTGRVNVRIQYHSTFIEPVDPGAS